MQVKSLSRFLRNLALLTLLLTAFSASAVTKKAILSLLKSLQPNK